MLSENLNDLEKERPLAVIQLQGSTEAQARDLSPEYYPTYRDMAYSINAQYGIDEAIDLLQEYIRTYADGQVVAYARKTIAELRGVEAE